MIFELAGIIGVEPWSFTLRELLIMAEAKAKTDWAQSSGIMSSIINVNLKKGAEPLPLDYFSPYKKKIKPIQDSKGGFAAMKEVFARKKSKGN